jgi:hypothetical protein
MGWTETPEFRSWLSGFIEELERLGWAEGRNLEIERRWTTPNGPRPMPRNWLRFAQTPSW